jgi:hypothetical protein
MASEVIVTIRFSRLWVWSLYLACAIAAQGVRLANWLADHPRVIIR